MRPPAAAELEPGSHDRKLSTLTTRLLRHALKYLLPSYTDVIMHCVLFCGLCCGVVHYRYPPEFITVLENKTVEIGDDAELVCRYISGEAAHVTWVKHYKVNGSYFDDKKVHYVTSLQVLFVRVICPF